MSEGSPPVDRRAQMVCLTGLILQVTLCGVVLAVGLWNGSDAIVAGARHLLGGVLIWVSLLIVYTQRKRSRAEDLETEQFQRSENAGSSTHIFDVGDENLLLERRRLNWTYKFVLPLFTILLAIYHIAGSFVGWSWPIRRGIFDSEWSRAEEPFVCMVFVAGAAFACFVFARYVVGMGRRSEWRMLRAGGSYLLGNALTLTVLVVATALAGNSAAAVWAEPLAAYIIRVVLLLLGVELVANFILEFYRPRQTDEDMTPAFDSRILALLSEPGGIARSIASTMNYQFGFEVSGTWFYQLLQRSVFPLVMLTVVVLIGMSAVVIVDADEEVIIERFGALVQTEGRTLGPGIHLKFPWPVDRIERARVAQIRELVLGEPDEEEEHEHTDPNAIEHAILWTEEHTFNSETMLLVADRHANALDFAAGSGDEAKGQEQRGRSVAVSLLMVSTLIEYRVKDLHSFAYRYVDPERVLESIADQELSDYAAGVDINELMGQGRAAFARDMKAVLQRRADELGLGIELTFVALQDAHPPSEREVASTFQTVIAAEIRKQAAIEEADGNADQLLTETAGSVERALALDRAIQNMERLVAEAERLDSSGARQAADKASRRVDELIFGDVSKNLAPCSGAVATAIAVARAERSFDVSEAESKTRTFANDVRAYETAPEIFRVRRYLDTLGHTLADVRKFVLTMDPDTSDIIIVLDTQQPSTLDLEPPQ